MAKLEQVFGVTSEPVLSYVVREDVDGRFHEALTSRKHVIVYGSSKQGKTALVSKYLSYDENLLVSLTPKTQVTDIYQTILSKAGVRVVSSIVEKQSHEASFSVGAKFKALIPLFGGAEAKAEGKVKAGSTEETKYEEIPLNLELPQSVCDLLSRVGNKRWVILENFHYLNDSIQQQLAFDLRAFQELGLQFVILGVWREKNRLAQFNGDLLDRIVEVPVEPWLPDDFKHVVVKGESELNIKFEEPLVLRAIDASFSSVGVFQELLKHMCLAAKVMETAPKEVFISDPQFLSEAIAIKANDYAARHQRALEAIAAGHTTGGAKGDLPPLFLPYYLVKVILAHGFDGIANGAHKNVLHDWIRAVHHRAADVRNSDMGNLLVGLANLQSAKAISPPILAFDAQKRLLQVVDSTFYFFIKNADIADIADSIQNPLELTGTGGE